MTPETQPCSVVIRCFNEEAHIGRLLTGLTRQTIEDLQIIVVDSGSTDASLAIASQFPVEILEISPEDFSFGRSLNIGFGRARGEVVVMASAHVYPLRRDWVEQLLEPFSDPSVAIVFGMQRGGESTRFAEHRIFAKWFPDEPTRDGNNPFCNNANAAIRKEVWERMPYDESLTGLEDVAMARDVIKAGSKVIYQPEAVVAHIHSETYDQVFYRYKREAMALRSIFPDERFGLFQAIRLFVSNVGADWVSAIRTRHGWAQLVDVAAFRFMQFFGTWRGFRTRHVLDQGLRRRLYYPGAPAIKKADVPHKELVIDYDKTTRE